MKNMRVFRQCVFPAAITPLQKALCATVGVIGACGTFYVSTKICMSVLSWVATEYKNDDSIREQYRAARIEAKKYPQTYHETRNRLHNAYFDLFVVPCSFPLIVGGSYLCGYKGPVILWKEISPALKTFADIFRGTKCCSIVRATAGFCFIAPIGKHCENSKKNVLNSHFYV